MRNFTHVSAAFVLATFAIISSAGNLSEYRWKDVLYLQFRETMELNYTQQKWMKCDSVVTAAKNGADYSGLELRDCISFMSKISGIEPEYKMSYAGVMIFGFGDAQAKWGDWYKVNQQKFYFDGLTKEVRVRDAVPAK